MGKVLPNVGGGYCHIKLEGRYSMPLKWYSENTGCSTTDVPIQQISIKNTIFPLPHANWYIF